MTETYNRDIADSVILSVLLDRWEEANAVDALAQCVGQERALSALALVQTSRALPLP